MEGWLCVVDEEGTPTGEVSFIWWSSEVLRVSDVSVQKLGVRGHVLKGIHQAGYVLLRWEANVALGESEANESWMGSIPSKWNTVTDQMYAWRRDPDYGMWSDPIA